MSSEKASLVKRQGHKDAIEFALLLGLKRDYQNDIKAKKDVIDHSGYSYSVKSGEKKWQIFLYSLSRFQKDELFQAMNGLGDLFIQCIECFPANREDYLKNKLEFKEKLSKVMLTLKEYLSNKKKLRAFFSLAFFNGNEVDFLVIKQDKQFIVFDSKEVVNVLTENILVETSQKRRLNEFDNQKVVFKVYDNNAIKTIGEIEMRNDSEQHYREVKFWMSKPLTLYLLTNKIKNKKNHKDKIILFGDAIKKFSKRKNVN